MAAGLYILSARFEHSQDLPRVHLERDAVMEDTCSFPWLNIEHNTFDNQAFLLCFMALISFENISGNCPSFISCSTPYKVIPVATGQQTGKLHLNQNLR